MGYGSKGHEKEKEKGKKKGKRQGLRAGMACAGGGELKRLKMERWKDGKDAPVAN